MARKPGSRSVAVTTGNARYKAWQTMRLWRKSGQTWTLREMVATDAALALPNVRLYVRALVDHGYVEIVQAKRPGVRGGDARHRLARDTGPNPPRIRADGSLFDPNLGRATDAPAKSAPPMEGDHVG